MSSAAVKWVRRQNIPAGSLKAVLMELASVSRDGVNAWPSQATITTSTGLSARTVWQSLRMLETLGVISRKRRSRGGREGRSSDMITLNIHREFDLTRTAVAKARAAVHATRRRPAEQDLQLANSAVATRNRCEGIKRDKYLPIQEEGKTPPSQDKAQARSRPDLTLVGGTSIEEGAA